jgi:hypothetical protein
MKIIAVFAVAVMLALVLTEPVLGHDHFNWIMNNPHTASCCGERDCRQIDGRVVRYEDPGIWFVQGKPVPRGRTFQSKDNLFYACYFDPGRWEQPRCLFIPGMS